MLAFSLPPWHQRLPTGIWSRLGARLAQLLLLTGLVLLLTAVQSRLPLQPDTAVESTTTLCAHGAKAVAKTASADAAHACEAGALIDIEDFDPPLFTPLHRPAHRVPFAWLPQGQAQMPDHPWAAPLRPPRLRA